jgi:YihY family inner membrane protein
MSSATRVPQTAVLPASSSTGRSATQTVRDVGPRELLTQSFLRFRYGDGFSHARALALQLALAVIPLVIALVGLGSALGTTRLGETVRRALLALTPGSSGDAVSQSLSRPSHGAGGQVALYVGLATALVALTTAMGQLERGSNRIYGIRRDHPGPVKYARAAVLALLAGLPALLGFLLLIAGGAFADAVDVVYGQGRTAVLVLRWPVGGLLLLGALSVMVARAPRRTQPARGWLLVGSGMAFVLWVSFSLLLAAYLHGSSGFGATYGPLTGVMALLLWSQLTALALLFGVAVGAQVEAFAAGVQHGAASDPEQFAGAAGAVGPGSDLS